MPLQLRPAVPDDIPRMRKVYYSAFSDTIVGRRVFLTNREASDRFFEAGFSNDMGDSRCQLLVVTHKTAPDSDDEQVVALSRWRLPGSPIDDPPPAEAWPACGDLAVEFFGAMAQGHRKIMGDRPHYYLELICTHADWQGRGAAGLLLRWGLERADAEQLPAFLEATRKGLPIYEKFGFQTRGQDVFDWPCGRAVEAYMQRDAKTHQRAVTRPRSKDQA
ncbi:hypothetical protein F66182_488 [Fusarium sp. NRRL 66182]|nr:hypothetical protein F66182_488 [Fusarium sp. NRRL 66182]